MTDIYNEIFKRSSKTYFYSSILFPREIKQKVARLYAFVRLADDFVDSLPQNVAAYNSFKENYYNHKVNGLKLDSSTESKVIEEFVKLERELSFDPAWADAFFYSMDQDLNPKIYHTIEDTEKYIYGSASVIGLFMSRILDLPKVAYSAAESLGMAFQYINFIRDINEDLDLGRNYFPASEMTEFGFVDLQYSTVINSPKGFEDFIHLQLEHYKHWQTQAQTGFQYIPKKYLIAIKTASDMYNWTAKQISKNPFIVYKTKIKPKKRQILLKCVQNTFSTY